MGGQPFEKYGYSFRKDCDENKAKSVKRSLNEREPAAYLTAESLPLNSLYPQCHGD